LVSHIKEEHRLRVFENRVLRRIFGPKRERVTGGSRKLNNELHNLYSSHYYYSDQINKAEMGGACRSNGRTRSAYRGLVRKPEAQTPLGIPRHR
jgi:hypothetical protein